MENFNIALCQMKIGDDKKLNMKKAEEMMEVSYLKGADVVVLPEMFNCPYDNSYFKQFAEEFNSGETVRMLSNAAKKYSLYIVGGSIPEKDLQGNIYNTCFAFNRNGECIGRHRKMHLFDIDVKNKIRFKESDTLKAGDAITVIDTEFCKIGIAICYDIRFPELFRIMALEGAKMVIVPAAFNMTTGPMHWETLFKSRSIDNEIYTIGVSPCRDYNNSYIAYGNSLIVSPWGEIQGKLDEKEDILFQSIDLSKIDDVREAIPVFKHRRSDIYSVYGDI